MESTEAVRTLANVLADAFAHSEAAGRSLIRHSDPDGDQIWLDFEAAGALAASALEIAGLAPDGRQLFMIPARLSVPPETSGAGVGGSETSAPAVRHAGNLVGQLLGKSREIISVAPVRHRWLLHELQRLRPGAPLSELHMLADVQLRMIIDRLEGHRVVKRLDDLGPGVHQPAGTS